MYLPILGWAVPDPVAAVEGGGGEEGTAGGKGRQSESVAWKQAHVHTYVCFHRNNNIFLRGEGFAKHPRNDVCGCEVIVLEYWKQKLVLEQS